MFVLLKNIFKMFEESFHGKKKNLINLFVKAYIVSCILQLPRFFQLCSDNVWGVRKACAECFMAVSCATSQEVRRTKLSTLFINLISDPSRWVRKSLNFQYCLWGGWGGCACPWKSWLTPALARTGREVALQFPPRVGPAGLPRCEQVRLPWAHPVRTCLRFLSVVI